MDTTKEIEIDTIERMGASLKFKCTEAGLINAIEKHGGVKNAVIDSDDDAEGMIRILIGVIGDGTFYENCERQCLDRIGDIDCGVEKADNGQIEFIVRLKAADEKYLKEFMTCAKKLQQLISETD